MFDDHIDRLIALALDEDVGTGDLTTAAVVPAGVRVSARINQKEPGVIAGLDAARRVFARLDPSVLFEPAVAEGEWRDGGLVVTLQGPAPAILAGERVALNLLGRLSGIATHTARFVEAVSGSGATILDTRKTAPGMRALEKAAVRAGGGTNHRAGLFDAILIKENHAALAGGVGAALAAAQAQAPAGVIVEVECASLAEVRQAIEIGAERILLDNMSAADTRAAVALAASAKVRPLLEASGGITLETIGEIAATGVDFISVGAVTHSAPVLDLSLLINSA